MVGWSVALRDYAREVLPFSLEYKVITVQYDWGGNVGSSLRNQPQVGNGRMAKRGQYMQGMRI